MWPNPQETANSVTFTEEIFNGKLHFFAAYVACLPSVRSFSNMKGVSDFVWSVYLG